VIVLIAAAITIAVRMTGKAIFSPFVLLYRVLAAVAGLVYRVVRGIILTIRATPGALYRVPIRAYRRLVMFRNWLLAKAEYLQAESAKWKTTFTIVKSPYSLLRGMGFTPQMAASLLIGASAVTGGVVVNETLLSEPSFANGDPGLYDAPHDAPRVVAVEGYNTLRIDLGSIPVSEILINSVSVGSVYTNSALPSGATTAIDVGGNGAAGTYLEVGTLVFERNRCDQLLLTDVQAHTLIIEHNFSDGQSVAPSAGTIRNRAVIGGHHQAEKMGTQGGTYDRIWISAPTSAVNGKIDKLTISNAYTRGGSCWLHRIKAGTVEIRLNEIGMGDGLALKDFTVETSVKASVITQTGNVEALVARAATVTADS
jgi:hypothetical protein